MDHHYTTSRWVGLAALLVMACGAPAPRPVLPTATGTYRQLDNTVEVALPDSGGYIFNGQPVSVDSLVAVLRTIFTPKPLTSRVIFVVDNPRRAWADVVRIADAARAAGGQAFDAASSGHGQGFTVVHPPTPR